MTTEDASPYAGTSPVAALSSSDGVVTLVEGQSFCVSGRAGDIVPELPHGLFLLDTRVVSRWELRVNHHPVETLAVDARTPFSGTFVGRGLPEVGRADADIVVRRERHVGWGMRERVTIAHHGLEPVAVVVDLTCDADFADLFAVKECRVRDEGARSFTEVDGVLRIERTDHRMPLAIEVAAVPAPVVSGASLRWTCRLDPGDVSELCIGVTAVVDGEAVEPRFRCGGHDPDALPEQRMATWRATLPVVRTDLTPLAEALDRAGEDLGALRIFDPEHPDLPILAAGAPWFMTVFGRDSLLTAWMTLIADPSLAHGVLETLARFQGREVVAETEEEPGKILHEMRFGTTAGLALGGGNVYYGSVDATPLFVALLGELRRWDPRDELVDRLVPHADRALAWIAEFGDRDGDGYVEYERQSDDGLVNQGWKDSWDAIRHADGRLAQGPIALAEVQGYVYAAYVARVHLAEEAGDQVTAEHYRSAALELRRRFNEDFWVDEHGWFAMALDGEKRPVDVLASNVGHCLWTGIVEHDRAERVAERLMSDDLFSGFGIRTLARSARAYNPVSYHNGSVWPHDNALCAAGLSRYGFDEAALRIIQAQMDVARRHHGRLPELFAGFDRGELSVPASYPASCSPQAWAAASPLLWLRTLLRLDPWPGAGKVWLDPVLPAGVRELVVSGIRVGSSSLTVRVDDGMVEVAPTSGLEVVRAPRPPATSVLAPPGSPTSPGVDDRR